MLLKITIKYSIRNSGKKLEKILEEKVRSYEKIFRIPFYF